MGEGRGEGLRRFSRLTRRPASWPLAGRPSPRPSPGVPGEGERVASRPGRGRYNTPMPRPGRLERLLLRFVLFVVAHPRATLTVCLLALIGCVGLAVFRLDISTDQNKLFDPHVPFFAD